MIELNGKNVESFGVAVVPIHRMNSSPVQVSLVITPVLFGHDLLIGSNAFKSLGLRVFDATEQKFVELNGSERPVDPVRVGSVAVAVPSDYLSQEKKQGVLNSSGARRMFGGSGRIQILEWNKRGGNNEGSGDENFKEIRIIATRKCRSPIQFYASIASKVYLSMVGRRGAELEDRSSGFQRTD